MKRILPVILFFLITGRVFGQTTYYWVGSSPGASNNNINNNANWNTVVDGSGSSRSSSTGATDILVFNGTNLGGTTSVTGPVTVAANAGITCAQMKFINNVTINMVRPSSGTTTITLNGEAGDDFVIEAGSTLNVPPGTLGSLRFAMAAANSGIVSGTLSFITGQQCRIDNTTAGTGILRFTNGASLITNMTPASAAYAFGNSTQSSPNWVVFESGSHLYYDGGFSPHGSGNLFSAIDMRPGSTWHHRANNPSSGAGNFFNQKSYGNVIVENNANLTALGSIFRIENLTINTGSTFTTHTSGNTVVLGQLTVNGVLMSDVASTNELVLAGPVAQIVSGSGTINIASLTIATNGDVSLNKDISVDKSVTVHGKLNFSTYKITGNATFSASGLIDPFPATGNLTAGSYVIPLVASTVPSSLKGFEIFGTGIAPNTAIVATSPNNDSVYLSNPVASSGTAMSLSLIHSGSTLQNNNVNGYDPASGSVIVAGNKTYDARNYIIDGSTSWPFGVTTGSVASPIITRFVEVNAPITLNRAFSVSDHLTVNGKITMRPLDVIDIGTSAVLNGNINASNYIVTASNSSTGDISILRMGVGSSATLFPIGTTNYYLPATISLATGSVFSATVFEGITTNGAVNGTQLTSVQKQNVVNAVWNFTRVSGSGNADLQISWNAALEGSTFATLPNTDIGLIQNTGSSWALPIGIGNNTTNTVTANVSSFGSFSAGAIPQVQPFVFNSLPPKTYGDADFNGGATSLNTTQPIVYSSSNPAVATIVGGNIHITGAGTTTITASQASDGFYPAASVNQPLTVAKANLTITADNKTKFEQQPNPTLTATYTGFVYGETPAVLTTQATISTTATSSSVPGTYPITVSGAVAANYNITYVNGTMTVQAKQNQTITFPAPATKTYGNADFSTGATSTNSTIPVTYAISNPAVASITGNTIHIVGAGTTTITASQAGNAGYFAATDVVRTLTVNKAPLAIRVTDTVKTQGQPNPIFTITYTGFVLGETVNNLTTAASVSTIATSSSPAGYYTLTPGGAVTNNYNITYTAGRLTIYPLTGTTQNHIHAFMSNGSTLTVRVYSTFPALADIKIYDFNGKPLLKKNVFLPQGFQNSDIDVSMIPAGIYVVTVTGSGVDLKKTIPIIKY